MNFHTYDETNAPEGSRELLAQAKEKFGFIPNLLGNLAESPSALKSYLLLSEAVEQTTLSPAEQDVLFLAVSYDNECGYCMAAHSAIAKMHEVDDKIIEAMRTGATLPDRKLEALRRFARNVVGERGWVSESAVSEFLQAGYEKRHVLDVILVASMKTLSNYTNHIAQTEVDEAFAGYRWSKPNA